MSEMKPDKTEQRYQDVVKMLYALSWSYNRRYGLAFEDCMSECHYAFAKANTWRHKEGKGTKFSTTVRTIANWRLKQLVIDLAKKQPHCPFDENYVPQFAPAMWSPSLELLDDLGDTARELVTLLLETPRELLGHCKDDWTFVPTTRTEHTLLIKVKRYLIDKKGLSKEDVDAAHLEALTVFQEEWAL